jgi:hypothetical protein
MCGRYIRSVVVYYCFLSPEAMLAEGYDYD